MLVPSRPTNAIVTTSIINKRWRQINPPMARSQPLLMNVYVNIQTRNWRSVNKGRAWKTPSCICNCLLNRRFATVTVGSCSHCWKLQRVADEARNMMENALSILIVIFFVQLQQTEISNRKQFIFQSSFMMFHNVLSVSWCFTSGSRSFTMYHRFYYV